MDIEELEESLSEILPVGFQIETNKKGQIVIFTGLKQSEDGELISLLSEEEDEDAFDSDFESLDSLDEDEDDE
jgi:hypothetical protein